MAWQGGRSSYILEEAHGQVLGLDQLELGDGFEGQRSLAPQLLDQVITGLQLLCRAYLRDTKRLTDADRPGGQVDQLQGLLVSIVVVSSLGRVVIANSLLSG